MSMLVIGADITLLVGSSVLGRNQSNDNGFNSEPLKDETVVFVDDDQDLHWYDSTHVETIQEGITNSSLSGYHTVFVYKGDYYGKIFINETIKLIGEDKEKTIIDCQRMNKGSKEGFITIRADDVRLTGFTIKNGYIRKDKNDSTSYLIKVDENVQRCDISENIIDDCFIGIILSDNNKYCYIYGNIIKNFKSFGVKLDKGNQPASNNRVVSNRIFRTSDLERDGSGIVIEDSSTKNLIVGNLIYGRIKNGTLLVTGASKNLVAFNRIKDCANAGILAFKPGEGNIIASNDLVNINGYYSAFFYEKDHCTRYKTKWLNNYYGKDYKFMYGGNVSPVAFIVGACNEKDGEFLWPAISKDLYPATKEIFSDSDFPWI